MGMMKRREFLISLTAASAARQDPIEVEVMEVFSSSTGPSALLVHHADERTRETFSNWMRNNAGGAIVCRVGNRTPLEGRIFRVNLCFGRGLILLRDPAAGIRAKDVLVLTSKE